MSSSTSQPTQEHLSGRSIDGGATASADATNVQEIVRRKMEAAKLASEHQSLRAEGKEVPVDEARVGTRSDGSFGLLSEDVVKQHEEVGDEGQITKPLDQMDIKPVRGILKNKDENGARKGSAGEDTLVGKEDSPEVIEEEKKEPELKRRVSKMWKSAIVKIRGPAVARGL